MSGEAVDRCVDDWTVAISELTDLMHQIRAHVDAGEEDDARAILPDETPYPVPSEIAHAIGMRP